MEESIEEGEHSKLSRGIHTIRISKGTTVLSVTMALLLDFMLLTVIIPIIPEILFRLEKNDGKLNEPFTVSKSQARTSIKEFAKENMIRYSTMKIFRSVLTTKRLFNPSKKDGANGTSSLQTAVFRLNHPTFNKDSSVEHIMLTNDTTLGSDIKPGILPSSYQPKLLQRNEFKGHKEIRNENLKVGFLLASKAIIQLLVNPIVGPVTDRIGYKVPMVTGFSIMFISTIVFALGSNYFWFLFARAFQGIGSSCASVAGMAVLAQSFPDYNERGNVMGIALSGGLALGVLFGPSFGGFMYEFVGASSPFIVLSFLCLIGLSLQVCIVYPDVKQTNEKTSSLKTLMADPQIVVVTGSILLANMAVGMLESSLPIIMMDRMEVELWQIGATFLPCSLSYMLGTCLFGRIAACIGRWLTSLLGLYMIGCAFIAIIFAYSPEFLIGPMAATGFGIGMVDSSMLPELGNLVDLRHSAQYGSVYAIGDIAVCIGFAVGPALGGGFAKLIGFKWMAVITSMICFIYGPLLIVLKSTVQKPTTEGKEDLPLVSNNLDQSGAKYDISKDEVMQTPMKN